jgi:hypothetical protein
MTGLVEALANIVLFILTPVVVVWAQSRLAVAIETVGKSPLEENDAEAVNLWAGNHEHVMPDLSAPSSRGPHPEANDYRLMLCRLSR